MNSGKMQWFTDWLSLGVGWPELLWARTTPERTEATPAPAVLPQNRETAA